MNHGTPIDEAVKAMELSDTDSAVILALPGVRTLGDLVVVLERGDVEAKLAARLRKALQ